MNAFPDATPEADLLDQQRTVAPDDTGLDAESVRGFEAGEGDLVDQATVVPAPEDWLA
ncbi:hypothetical protein LV457_08790 [Mycobacterium sp. MYCO198283]|uniref:hypothetical protein n=1 Tax=Mycobacterium sp. MYCO198283 TaxID=2883505 RepID=UPI001E38FE35|nr:hypothetical protein [Mycobacterium sp. MYCO198283]MCG5432390.1 hypothetical protein [Mycobacterium sp. MYCO198283]